MLILIQHIIHQRRHLLIFTQTVFPTIPKKQSYAKASLVHKSTGSTIVMNTIVGLYGAVDFRNPLEIYPSDPRGIYYVFVGWYNSAGTLLWSARSNDIYLTA